MVERVSARYLIMAEYPDTLYMIVKDIHYAYVLRQLMYEDDTWQWGAEFGYVENAPCRKYKTYPKRFQSEVYEA